MILGIGTDIAQVDRFKEWKKYSNEQLLRVFSMQELKDCSHDGALDLQRLASRFAAKEAFYKAMSAVLVKLNLTNKTFSFLFACKHVQVIKPVWGVPQLQIDWQTFEQKIGTQLPKLDVNLSISHEQIHVVAFVVVGLV